MSGGMRKRLFLSNLSLNDMKTMTVSQFKAHFSEAIAWVRAGQQVGITLGKNRELIGVFMPQHSIKTGKRKLGILEGKASASFHNDFKMTEEEFLG